MLGKNARLKTTLNNIEGDAPIEWNDISIKADFESGNIEPKVETDSFTFVNELAQQIKDWLSQGRIFEGIPFKISAYNSNSNFIAFDGYVNCSNNIEILDDTTIKANIQLAENTFTLKDRMSGITMSYLESIGVFSASDYTDVKYVVEKSDNTLEILLNTIVVYSLTVSLQTQIEKTSKSIAQVTAYIGSTLR